MAVKDLKVEIVSLLLEGGANPLILDDADLTPINYATAEFDEKGLSSRGRMLFSHRSTRVLFSVSVCYNFSTRNFEDVVYCVVYPR